MLTEAELNDVQLSLENEGRFHKWCTANIRFSSLTKLSKSHWFNAMKYFYDPARNACISQADFLREYFIWRYETDQSLPAPEFKGPLKKPVDPTKSDKWRTVASGRFSATEDSAATSYFIGIGVPNTFTDPRQPEFNPMAQLKFKTLFTLNGVDVSTLTDEQIYTAIKAEEDRIAQLKLIKNQPKKLQTEITAAEAQLTKLIEHLDSK